MKQTIQQLAKLSAGSSSQANNRYSAIQALDLGPRKTKQAFELVAKYSQAVTSDQKLVIQSQFEKLVK